jgi:DNA polymerase elongation subunit (family B)
MTGEDLSVKKNRIKELQSLIYFKKKEYDYNKAMQLALKLTLNGTYGAFANKHFVCSNADIANAITAHGRDVIQFMLNKIEQYFYYDWHNDTEAHALLGMEYIGVENNMFCFYDRNLNQLGYPKNSLVELLEVRDLNANEIKKINNIDNNKGIDIQYEYFVHDFNNVKQLDENPIFTKEGDTDYEGFIAYKGKNPVTIYGDTDSVHNQTVINVYGENIIVEDWYNKNIKNGSAGVTLKGHESVKTDDKILNWSEDEGLYYVPVKRIIRHKVSKEKWKLKTKSGKEIIVTNDHSMIVFRNDKKIEIKPRDILKLDKILAINELPLN